VIKLVRYAQRFISHERRDYPSAKNRLLFARERLTIRLPFESSSRSEGLVDDRAIRLQELPK